MLAENVNMASKKNGQTHAEVKHDDKIGFIIGFGVGFGYFI